MSNLFRPSSPLNPRPASKSRGSKGGGAPLAVRRGPGEPLWNGSPGAPLPSFAALRKKVAPAGAKEPSSCSRPRRSGQSSGLLRIRRLRLRFVPLSHRLRRASSEHTSLAPFPQNRDTAKTPYRSVAPPLQIETQGFDLRRTFRRNHSGVGLSGRHLIFRRIRTRNSSPSCQGGRGPHWIPRGFTGDGGRETKRVESIRFT